MHVIALTGDSGAGKDTLARHLRDQYGYRWVSFAQGIRDTIRYPAYLDPKEPTVERDDWERRNGIKDVMISKAKRMIIQDPFVFVDYVDLCVRSADTPVVISDLRSPMELQSLMHLGSPLWVIRIVRPKNPHPIKPLDNGLRGYPFPEITNYEITEEAKDPTDSMSDQLCGHLRSLPWNH